MLAKQNPILHQSYPVSHSGKEIWLSSSGLAIAVYLFLVIFQPFGTYNYVRPYKYLLLVPYSIIAFMIFTIGNFMLARRSPRWNFFRELLKMALLLSICSLLNYGYSIYFINEAVFTPQGFLYMGLFTFALGSPVCCIYLLARYIYLKRRTIYSDKGNAAGEMPAVSNGGNYLTVNPMAGNKIGLLEDNFIYARSEGNYSVLYYLADKQLKKQLLRISLKNLEEQIGNTTILRCHRSFIVNADKIKSRKGNAQGYKLVLEHIAGVVPVSRKYMDALIKGRE